MRHGNKADDLINGTGILVASMFFYFMTWTFGTVGHYSFLIRDIAFIQTFEIYLKYLFDFLDSKRGKGYIIKYITDAKPMIDTDINDNRYSYIFNYNYINETISINNNDSIFYKINRIILKLSIVKNSKNLFQKIYNRYIKNNQYSYDNKHFYEIYNNIDKISIQNNISKINIERLIEAIDKELLKINQIESIQKQYKTILKNILSLSYNTNPYISIHPFTFLSKYKDYMDILLCKANKIPTIFMQHGSYLQENIFLKYNEIYPADINLVFNDYAQKLFEKRGAKKVYSIGSINFNYHILDKKIEYDFLYIIYCTSYGYTSTYIGSEKNLLSVDGKNIFNRHQRIIELFGKKFKDKKICIKIQPGIFTGSMLYVPFLELSKNYPNVTIEFSVPIQKLIQKSKYIISDYFSSEFINRELHYKRDIILFKGSPLPLPKETIEDMKKMFILVDTVDDLKDKITNIEAITKNRKRYDDIIEYYSSKKCDTKKVVTEILKKELNGN